MSNRLNPKRKVNYLPVHLGTAFELELDDLIVDLSSTEGFKGAYLLSEYKSKYIGRNTASPDQRRAAAITKWLSVEETNRKTNLRLLLGDESFQSSDRNPDGVKSIWTTSDRLIAKARSIIDDVLGPLDYHNIFVKGNHSNGASTRIRRSEDAAIQKHTGQAHVSERALKHWFSAASATVLSNQTLRVQEESVMFTVPKATEIDRVACKEPEINMYLQRIVGRFIGKKLRRRGIDLTDQTVNQALARDALRDGLATIDLSSASDSITTQLVCELLPVEWFCLLNDLRVHRVSIDGNSHEPEMFSSMGNGFTFELESLLFYALARAIAWESHVKGRISVYGDDIIVPRQLGARLQRVFAWFGFKVNSKKSNWSGKFRESCGKHYYNHREVTPFYLRAPVMSKVDIIRILNRLLEWDSCGLWCITHPAILEFHLKWSKVVPKSCHGGQDPQSDSALVTGTKPHKRFVRATKDLNRPSEEATLTFWYTLRECTGIEPVFCDLSQSTHYTIVDQPAELYRTTWDPYLLWEGPTVSGHTP